MSETVTLPVLRRAILSVVKDKPIVRILQEAEWPQMAVIMTDDGRIGMVSPECLQPHKAG